MGYQGAWQQAPTMPLARTHSAPVPVPQPVQAPQPAPVAPVVEEPAEPGPVQQLLNRRAAEADNRRRFAELVRPGLMFRLFMFYYLFCSPTLPEWQRTAFIGALVMFYMYTVGFMGYMFPSWRRERQ